MKKTVEKIRTQIFLMCILVFSTVVAFAQNGSGGNAEDASVTVSKSTTTTTTTQNWYAEPWVWIAGAAVFILLLIALIRGGGSTVERKTIIKKD